ncbi:hypothetical protein SAMN05444161_1000 [Rhizobiales bacterium GAS191]|nr:hypothetical protein SAMN05519103_00025 [Rhizobiales bacterium GAS113]SEC36744.1 hypothetical protein SAMN05444161_1000 [Rhizobiales bacterium GAS191]
MRASSVLAIALLAASAFSTVPADAASQHRQRYYRAPVRAPFVVQVAPRSFLDPGPVVPVGSLSNYVYASQYPYSMPYSYTNHYGRPPLPEGSGYVLFDRLDFGPLSGP